MIYSSSGAQRAPDYILNLKAEDQADKALFSAQPVGEDQPF